MSRGLTDPFGPSSESALRREAAERDRAAIERANEAMAGLKAVYATEWAPAAVSEMDALVAELEASGPGTSGLFERIYRLSHDMKGQGTTFGYALLTQIGEALCRLTANRESASEGETMLLRAHVNAARQILGQRLEGSGGEAGARIMAGLALLARRAAH